MISILKQESVSTDAGYSSISGAYDNKIEAGDGRYVPHHMATLTAAHLKLHPSSPLCSYSPKHRREYHYPQDAIPQGNVYPDHHFLRFLS